MRILFIGDIIGKTGRQALSRFLPELIDLYQIDACIANAENAAGGFGITPKVLDELFLLPIDLLTSGNHIWDKREVYQIFEKEGRLLRPANYPVGTPGTGSCILETKKRNNLGVINLAGRVFMDALDCPFRVVSKILEELEKECKVIIVDIHAEATSEKVSLGWYLDGRVSAVIGTHTHVQTADEKILPNGTAYITDVGMAGAFDSVIGLTKEMAIERFLTQRPNKFEVAKKNPGINAVVVEVDEKSGKAVNVFRVQKMEE
ncbi:MAG: TIGR00282 family metallophosphoesterase [bacterium]